MKRTLATLLLSALLPAGPLWAAEPAAVTQPGEPAAAELMQAGRRAHEAGDAATALARYEQALRQLPASGSVAGQRSRVQALIGLSRANRVLRRLPAAVAAADEATALLDSLGPGPSVERAELHNARTLLAYARQDMAETLRLARAEVAEYQALGQGDSAKVLDAYATQGAVLGQLHRMAESNAILEQGLALMNRLPAEPPPPPGPQLGILHNLATNYNDEARTAAAIGLAERAVALAGRAYGEGHARQLVGTVIIAKAHALAGRLGLALRAYDRALAIAEAQPQAVSVVQRLRLLDGIAQIHLKLGDAGAARQRLEQGLALAGGDAELGFWRGRFQRQAGILALRESRWADAEAALTEAADRVGASLGATRPTVLEIQAERCTAQALGGSERSACRLLAPLVPTLAEVGPAYRYRVHAALALDAQAAGDAEATLAQHLLALAAARRTGSADPLWSAFDGLARALRRQGEPALAVFFGKQAVAAIEALRGEVAVQGSAALERSFVADKAATYRRLAEWLAEDGRIDEALATLRLLKEEEFLDFMQRDAGLLEPGRRSELTPTEQRLRQRWQALEAELPAAAGPAPASAPPGPPTPGSEAHWAREAQRMLGELAGGLRNPQAAAAPAAPLQPAGQRPPPGQLWVYAISSEQQLTLVFDSAGRRESLQQPLDAAALGRDIGDVLAATSQPRASGAAPAALTATPALQRLQALIGNPLARAADHAGARHIVLHLDGVLRYLPLAVLHDGRRYLGERYALSHRVVAGGAAAAAPMPVPPASATPRRLQALGVTREWAGLKALQGVAQEVCGIVDGPVWGLPEPGCGPAGQRRGTWQGEAWMDAHFTAERLTEATQLGQQQGAAMLHVGTHFTLRPGNVARSWLLLGDGSRLHLDELARYSFAGHALVTLSACETGLTGGSPGGDGRELDGLHTLVMRRGARAVLASLWRVDDASTSQLMRHFYRELARHAPAEALRRAQQALRQSADGRWAAPRHWAGFYLSER